MPKTYLFVYEKDERVTGSSTGTHPKRSICYPSRPTYIVGYKILFYLSCKNSVYTNADKRRYNAANLRSFAFICGSNSLVYLVGDIN